MTKSQARANMVRGGDLKTALFSVMDVMHQATRVAMVPQDMSTDFFIVDIVKISRTCQVATTILRVTVET